MNCYCTEDSGFYHCFGPPDRSILYPENFSIYAKSGWIRRESEKRVLAAVIRTEEQERQRFAKELHDGLGPLLSVIKMLVSGLDANKESEVNEKIKQNLRQAVDEAISGVRDISANISPHILNNFGLKMR